ncbi:hypothetical protein [Sphingobium boeckii]|uniref:TolA-binding protein n=1 Tax=Sphingobium boeckii TaxID=1082345 RepID=A0A7W9AE66_9SPHN|nr:hypothetical protein [Sphingobium boeckii]MBB5684029.1 TolA-binding protein [Sphingobium boeckii]
MRKFLILSLLLAGGGAAPLAAQDSSVTGRVTKLEKEMKAVQRKVFPGGTAQFAEPDIRAPVIPPPVIGDPASNPVADLSERVSALESQVRELTGQSEQNAFKLRQIEDAQTRLDARLKAIEIPQVQPPAMVEAPGVGAAPTPGATSDTRKTELAAIQKPKTADPADDSYTYGYRLWAAKFYPEAQTQLRQTVEKYPKYKKISSARFWLGRALLEDGKPAAAAKELAANYDLSPQGERAPDSVYYLGIALTRYGSQAGACKAFATFNDVYGATATPTLKASVAKGRADAKCK